MIFGSLILGSITLSCLPLSAVWCFTRKFRLAGLLWKMSVKIKPASNILETDKYHLMNKLRNYPYHNKMEKISPLRKWFLAALGIWTKTELCGLYLSHLYVTETVLKIVNNKNNDNRAAYFAYTFWVWLWVCSWYVPFWFQKMLIYILLSDDFFWISNSSCFGWCFGSCCLIAALLRCFQLWQTAQTSCGFYALPLLYFQCHF